MANFGIKDCFDLKFYELGQSTEFLVIDYLNSGSFSLESEKVAAKKKGVDAITFAGARTGTLTIESEMADVKLLGMALGGAVTGEKIDVTSVVPGKFFKIIGTFLVRDEMGVDTKKQITFWKASPQPNSELAFSATDIASFSLTFDLLLDANNKLLTWENAVVGLSVEDEE